MKFEVQRKIRSLARALMISITFFVKQHIHNSSFYQMIRSLVFAVCFSLFCAFFIVFAFFEFDSTRKLLITAFHCKGLVQSLEHFCF